MNTLYNSHFSSKADWLYGFSLEGRFDEQPGLFYQGLAQAQIGYQLYPATQIWGGYTWIPITMVSPAGRVNTSIQRIYQELDTDLLKTLNYKLSSRTRLEERHKIDDNGIGVVFRQLLNFGMPRWTIKNTYTPFLSEEFFINMNNPTWNNQKLFNQNRLMFGFSFPCNSYTCQVAYLNQFLIAKSSQQRNNVLCFNLTL